MNVPTLHAVFDDFGRIFEAASPVAKANTCVYCGKKLPQDVFEVCKGCFEEDLDSQNGVLNVDLTPVELEDPALVRRVHRLEASLTRDRFEGRDRRDRYAEARDRQLWEAHQ